MIEYIDDETEIENLYKTGTNAPYTKAGKGYLGVLLARKSDGKIQCHICGAFYNSMAQHARIAHGVNARAYRKRFGFPSNMPLCSRTTSANTRRGNAAHTRMVKGSRNVNYGGVFKKPRHIHNAHTQAFLNSRSLCNEQVDRRVMVIIDSLGHVPGIDELMRIDSALASRVVTVHGTWQNYCKRHNFSLRIRQIHNKHNRPSNDKLLSDLRAVASKIGRSPSSVDWSKSLARRYGMYGFKVYKKSFGSWRHALAAAGLL